MRKIFLCLMTAILPASLWAGTITISGSGAAGGGSSSGGGIVSPGTFTWTNHQGFIVSTVTIDSGGKITWGDGTVQISSPPATLYPNSLSINGNYTAVSTTTVLLASSTFNGITITLPLSNTVTNHEVTINKVDVTTYPVTVQTSGSDLIAGVTNFLTLYAPGQSMKLLADGGNTWVPTRIPNIPTVLGVEDDATAVLTLVASSNAYCSSFNAPDFEAELGISFRNTAVSGNMDLGTYDSKGNRLASIGMTVVPAAGAHTLNFASPLFLAPGNYWNCLTANNTTASFGGVSATGSSTGGACLFSTSSPLPTTLTFTGCSAPTRKFAIPGAIAGGRTQ